MGFTELILESNNDLDAELIDNLERIQNSAEKLRLYIDQLMDVMKIDADKISLIRSNENISNLIKNCASELELEANNKNINITLFIPDTLLINFDPILCNIMNSMVFNIYRSIFSHFFS